MEVSPFTSEEISKLNAIIRKWGNLIHQNAKSKISELTDGTGELEDNSKNTFKRKLGLISAMTEKFPRHGVFVEMGVFGGHSKKTLEATGELKPKPWLNPSIEEVLPKLSKELASETSLIVVDKVAKGIKNT